MKENHRKDPASVPVICYSCGTPIDLIMKNHQVFCPDCLKYYAEAIAYMHAEKQSGKSYEKTGETAEYAEGVGY